jgi:DMSO reductase anchor subunit
MSYHSLIVAVVAAPLLLVYGSAITAPDLALLAIGAATFHLGRPLYAFRALLGLRTSWMSREILAFGLFAKTTAIYALSLASDALPAWPALRLLFKLRVVWEMAAAAFGVIGVACSVMVYAATRRTNWQAPGTGFKFVGSTIVLGAAALHAISVILVAAGRPSPFADANAVHTLLATVMVMTGLKLAYEATIFVHLRQRQHTVGKRIALLMVGDLRAATVLRFITGSVGGLLIPAAAWQATSAPGWAVAAAIMFLCVLGGEFIERMLFFKTAPPSHMPGGLN